LNWVKEQQRQSDDDSANWWKQSGSNQAGVLSAFQGAPDMSKLKRSSATRSTCTFLS
jgi:hypothetical protein